MRHSFPVFILSASTLLLLPSIAEAGNITEQGAVTALTDVNELQGVLGTADFSDPVNVYAMQGMTFETGPLTNILNGVVTGGSASLPSYQNNGAYFPGMIAGGGVAAGTFAFHAGVVTFAEPVTQLGLTASKNGTQYLTVWDLNGVMIGQVTWQPANDAAFVGIDTNGVPIGMAAYGNDNLWNGGAYGIGGSTIISDTWMWALGTPCETDNDCIDDQNPCTAPPVCQDGQCIHVPDDNGVCPDDGEPCTFDVCQNGLCTHPNNVDGVCPDDGNECTDDMCLDGVCSHPDNQNPCDDMNMCTENDVCGNGSCDGDDVVCGDQNLCTLDTCEPELGCQFDWQMSCCLSDEDCADGEICLFGSNSCIPDPNPGDGDGDTGDGDGDGDTGDGDGDGDTNGDGDGDGDGDTTGDGDGDAAETGSGEDSDGDSSGDSSGGETVGFDTFGNDISDEGCNCDTNERGTGALFGLFGLALFGAIRRRRED